MRFVIGYLTVLLCIGLLAMPIIGVSQARCDYDDILQPPAQPAFCRDSLDFDNAPLLTNSVPFKEISVVFHVIRDAQGANNFQDSQQDRAQLQSYIDEANEILGNLMPHEAAHDCDHIYTPESRIRLVVKGYEFYENDDLICTDTRCQADRDEVYDYCMTNASLGSEELDRTYPIIIVGWRGSRDSEYTDCGRDGCARPVKKLGGVGLPNYSLLRGVYANRYQINSVAELLLEEFCHSFGLGHVAFDRYRCCILWEADATNNLMDADVKPPYYDGHRALVPCQLGILHYNIEQTFRKKFLVNDLCIKQSPPIKILAHETVVWDVEEYVTQDVIVAGALIARCNVHLAEDVSIILVGDGKFVAEARVDSCGTVNSDVLRPSNSVEIFPNPANAYVSIRTRGSPPPRIDLFNANGQLLKSWHQTTYLDVSHLTPGFYVLRIHLKQDIQIHTFTKL